MRLLWGKWMTVQLSRSSRLGVLLNWSPCCGGRKHVEGSRVMYWIICGLVMDGTVEKVLL